MTLFNLVRGVMYAHAHNTILRPFYQIVLFIQPIVVATTAYMLYGQSGAPNFANYIVVGSGLAGIWSAMTFSSAGDVERERLHGMFSALMASPTRLPLIFTAKIVMNALLSILALFIALIYSLVFLKIQLVFVHPSLLLIAFLLFLFGASSFALMLSTLFMLTRTAWIFQNILESPLLILGGIAFPITLLPKWLQWVSTILPMRWGSEALRHALRPEIAWDHYLSACGWTLAIGALYYCLSLLLFNYIEYRVRVKANLEVF